MYLFLSSPRFNLWNFDGPSFSGSKFTPTDSSFFFETGISVSCTHGSNNHAAERHETLFFASVFVLSNPDLKRSATRAIMRATNNPRIIELKSRRGNCRTEENRRWERNRISIIVSIRPLLRKPRINLSFSSYRSSISYPLSKREKIRERIASIVLEKYRGWAEFNFSLFFF